MRYDLQFVFIVLVFLRLLEKLRAGISRRDLDNLLGSTEHAEVHERHLRYVLIWFHVEIG